MRIYMYGKKLGQKLYVYVSGACQAKYQNE